MSSGELQPIEVVALDLADLKHLRKVLNRFAAEGYAPLIGTYVPVSATGGAIVYVLGDASQVGPAALDDAAEIQEADAAEAPEPPAATPREAGEPAVSVTTVPGPSVNGNGNGHHVDNGAQFSGLQEIGS